MEKETLWMVWHGHFRFGQHGLVRDLRTAAMIPLYPHNQPF